MHVVTDDFHEYATRRAEPLHRAAYLLCGDWHLADDLVQEALVKTFRHWNRVRRTDNPDAYVRRILVNEANRHWRRNRLRPGPAAYPADEPATADGVGLVNDRLALLQALQRLAPRQRATVVLRFFEGLSERETADALGCSEGTVKSQTSRALRTLSTFFELEEIAR
ncbi:MAG TPA: SigE family RNA polymerase sigma factor [Mycobacteriales bacterium]